jgi:hypothetical protein
MRPRMSSTRFFADGQSQPGATVFAGGGCISLAEGLEHLAALLGCHADAGVLDPEVQLDAVLWSANFSMPMTTSPLVGELDGVVAQVDEDLAQTQGVAHQAVGTSGGC